MATCFLYLAGLPSDWSNLTTQHFVYDYIEYCQLFLIKDNSSLVWSYRFSSWSLYQIFPYLSKYKISPFISQYLSARTNVVYTCVCMLCNKMHRILWMKFIFIHKFHRPVFLIVYVYSCISFIQFSFNQFKQNRK